MPDIIALVSNHPWSMYAIAALLPFVQEDAAVIGAATTSVGSASPMEAWGLLFSVWAGLIVSDGWKYWAGRLAHNHPWAAKIASHAHATAARERVLERLGMTLIVARFVPGTRIPLYVACGLFRVPFVRFLPLIMLSAALYVGIAYGVIRALGAAFGEQIRVIVPIAVIVLVLIVIAVTWLRRRAATPANIVNTTDAADAADTKSDTDS
jgi:membrane protein DedA with SNARE-associated domain